MVRKRAVLAALLAAAGLVAVQTAPASVTITWLGHATFVMTTGTGLKALLDPTNPGAYKPAPVDGVDVITITHEHPDHTYTQMATGSPLVLRGLTADGFANVDRTIKGVRIRTVPAYHDTVQGAQRGRNAIFVYEMPGLRVAHLGDLGHKLDPEQASAIGPVDVLMTPMAGGPTMDGKTALEVIGQLSAKVVIPMHYATAAMAGRMGQGPRPEGAPAGGPPPGAARGGFSMSGVDAFLKLLDPSVKVEQAGHQVTLTSGALPAQRTVLVMAYE